MYYDKSNMKAIILFVIELVETRIKINLTTDIGKQLNDNISSLKRFSLTNFDNYKNDHKVIQKNLALTLYYYEQHIKMNEIKTSKICSYLGIALFTIAGLVLFFKKGLICGI